MNECNYAGVGNLSSLAQASLHNYYVYLILTPPPEGCLCVEVYKFL